MKDAGAGSSTSTRIIEPAFEAQRYGPRLAHLFEEIVPANSFQTRRFPVPPHAVNYGEFQRLPLLTKEELVNDVVAHPAWGSNLTYPLERYTRFHQTSGTKGQPLPVLDTAESWVWWQDCWIEVFRAAGLTAADRVFVAYSFAPFIGFWSAFCAAERMGCLCIPSGGANTAQRLKLLLQTEATVLISTPTYALRMAEEAHREGLPIADSAIRVTIHAGEPGASVPGTRARIAEAWGARVADHAGASEVGAWGLPSMDGRGLFVNEKEFVAEVLDPDTCEPVPEGQRGELVITNFHRQGWPVIRYRTGDVVAPRIVNGGGSPRLLLEGGVLGRVDDMITVRGVNVYPAALESIIREFSDFAEFRITAARAGDMDEVGVELERDASVCAKVQQEIRNRIGIRIPVEAVSEGALPRWEAKARRLVDQRKKRRETP